MTSTSAFRDFDAFTAAVRDVECRMMLQNPGRRLWTIDQVQLGQVDVQYGCLGSGNIVEGQSWLHGYLFYLPLSPVAYTANGLTISSGSFMVMEPGCEFCISTAHEHDWCSAFVPSHLFAGKGSWLDKAPGFSGSQEGKCYVTRPDHRITARFEQIVREILLAGSASERFTGSEGATMAERKLVEFSARILGSPAIGDPGTGRKMVSREQIIKRSKAHMEEQAANIPGLACAAGVSERTLRNAFNEYFQTSPIRYFKLIQLYRVHRALKRAEPEVASVTDILLDNGVFEFGRFAVLYRRHFGGLPSDTLHQKSPDN
jgi:AraC family ethanolamine operon transcriptional activator